MLLVDVDADDVVAELGHARGVHGPEVAAADDGKSHELPLCGGFRREYRDARGSSAGDPSAAAAGRVNGPVTVRDVLQPSARRGVVVALAVYLALVARLTLWPAPAPSSTFDLVRELLAWLSRIGVPLTYAGLEAGANVLMFVPFGVLVGLLVRRALARRAARVLPVRRDRADAARSCSRRGSRPSRTSS